jgi:hypothetical protein
MEIEVDGVKKDEGGRMKDDPEPVRKLSSSAGILR